MTVTDSETGNLVGIVGRVGEKRANKLLNHALIPHTPGSVLKPIALYAPLIETEKINWASVFDDVPVEFIESSDTIKPYPRNSPDVYDGLITVKDAVTFSKNTVAVRLCHMLGAKNIFNSLRDNYGFESLVEGDSGLSDIATAPMALGQLTRGVSLFRLTEAYSVFPSEGIRKEAKSYTRLVDYRGEKILGEKKNEKRILSEETSRIMNQLLMNVTGEGTARGLELKKNVDLAGKTGTSGNNRDKLFIGYTPYYTAGIWCGYENGGREVKGLSKGHLQIWDEIMCQIHLDKINKDEKKNFSTDGLVYMPYCRDSGQLFDNVCTFDPRGDRRDFGYFKIGSQPSAQCTRHIMCAYDSVTKAIACPDCPKENLVGVALIHNESRAFPIEINISDAEYVYRDISGYLKRPIDFALPYFYYSIPDGVYVGRSKSKKQFNSNCYIHDH
jgi:penicillin-binding protein 1A